MPVSQCRVCAKSFFKTPLLRYQNMPKAAQFLPEKKDLSNEKGVNLDVWQCSGCGLVQLSNDPVPYYREVIRAVGISQEMSSFRKAQFTSFVEHHALKNKKILEIGCGRGEYLSLMKNCGVQAYGIEASPDSVSYCKQSGLNVSMGFDEDATYKVEGAPFDSFFVLNFLEHLPNLNSGLAGIANNLREGAIGLIEVPNFDMILRKNLFSEFIGDHLFYFTKETLNSTLCQNGFEVIGCKEVWHDYIISAVVQKRARMNISHFTKAQEKIKDDIDQYLARFKNKEVAIWGAGHQSLAIISLLNLGERIKFVVDSAPFKQGKYTPATHLPIVAPDRLESDLVEAIIVMAASYSDEVVRNIRQKFSGIENIAILRDFGLEIV